MPSSAAQNPPGPGANGTRPTSQATPNDSAPTRKGSANPITIQRTERAPLKRKETSRKPSRFTRRAITEAT